MNFIDGLITTVSVVIFAGFIWLFVVAVSDMRQQTRHFKQVCTEQKGVVVYNGRNLECLK